VIKALEWFVRIWIGLFVLWNLISIYGLFIIAGGFWSGVWSVIEWYSPFDVVHWIVELLLFSPALLANYWAEGRRARINEKYYARLREEIRASPDYDPRYDPNRPFGEPS
jgi:hypothetical protein